jgi:Ca2+-binding RTX toxin-like protein
MTLEEIIGKVRFWTNVSATQWEYTGSESAPEIMPPWLQNEVLQWITELYQSATGRSLLERAAAADVLNFGAGSNFAASVGSNVQWIKIDIELTPRYYFNDRGVLVERNFVHTLAHELSHLSDVENTSDPLEGNNVSNATINALFDVRGRAVDFQNRVARELGDNQQIRTSYFDVMASDESRLSNFQIGQGYTNGAGIDNARIGDRFGRDDTFNTTNLGASRDLIFGLEGNDTITSGAGEDHVYGGAGFDTIYGGADRDILYGEDGEDYLEGNEGRDALYGGAMNDGLVGGEGDDWLDGGAGADTLVGGEGNDRLEGGAGADTLYGGAGNDEFIIDEQDVLINGGAGYDTLNLSGFSSAVNWTIGGENSDAIGAGMERIIGTNFADTFTMTEDADANIELDGGRGNDTLTGNAADNQLSGGADSDILLGLGGNDALDGGDGDDVLDGGSDDDILRGGAGDDLLYEGSVCLRIAA